MTAQEEALRAADAAREAGRIVAAGWTQGLWRRGGSYCAVGAISVACEHSIHGRAFRAVYEEASRRVGYLSCWNDEPGRQQHEVVELFEQIAKHFDREASRAD